MLNVIVDACHPNPKTFAHPFYCEQSWHMNLMHATNRSQGIARLLAREIGLPEGQWHIATPIHWEASHNDVMIVAEGPQAFTQAALHVFQQFLEADGIEVYPYSSHLWLFQTTQMSPLDSACLYQVMNCSFKNFLVDLPTDWRTWFTEIQMLFYRELKPSHSPINGVWVWGTGDLHLPQEIWAMGDFPGIEAKPWTLKTPLLAEGVLLVGASHATQIESFFSKQDVQWWWRDQFYQILKPSLWQKLRAWIHHEN